MKKLIICTFFLLAFMFLFSSTVSADLIPDNSRPLSRCIKVVNLNEFPDLVLIGYHTGPMINKFVSYQIKNNECLTKGYKFNSLSIYWNTKDKPDSIEPSNLLLENVESNGVYISNDSPLVKEEIEYSLARFSDRKFVLYKSKQTLEYNNGTPKKIETNNFLETKIQIIKSFLHSQQNLLKRKFQESTIGQSVICFFSGLAGKGCQ